MTTWKLTGKPSGSGECEHCGRNLVHRYEVTSTEGAAKIVGRGCLKAVTGWTLTAAQAERELRMIGIRADRAARWAEFAAEKPGLAATILADCDAYAAMYRMGTYGAGASHAVKLGIEEGHRHMVDGYLAARHGFPWARSQAQTEAGA